MTVGPTHIIYASFLKNFNLHIQIAQQHNSRGPREQEKSSANSSPSLLSGDVSHSIIRHIVIRMESWGERKHTRPAKKLLFHGVKIELQFHILEWFCDFLLF